MRMRRKETFIDLPQSGKRVTPGSDYSTGHYYICDY